jgi:hypothetical protein
MKTITKTGLITLVAVTAVALAPQAAFAKAKTKAKKSVSRSSTTTVVSESSSTSARLSQLEAEVRSLRGELVKARGEAKSTVASISEKEAAQERAIEARLVEHENAPGKNTLSFRGGFAQNDTVRGDNAALGAVDALAGGLTQSRGSDGGDGWYVGAAIDHRLTNNLWGLTDLAAVDGELMFEYKNFGNGYNWVTGTYNQLTQFTLSAAPKIKFNTGTIVTPWIIPAGLALHVISPPSNGVTVLNPGLMLGAGAEVEIFKYLVAGFDFRYHFTGDDLKGKRGTTTMLTMPGTAGASFPAGALGGGVSTDGLTTGAYLGFKW